jgi:pimeloyl-ACP methyl ester carboxylesterase
MVCALSRGATQEDFMTASSQTVTYQTANVDGLSIFYREAGPRDAPTLLLLHGFPSSSHMFRDLMPALAAEFHLVAPDYPGFGNSDAPSPAEFHYTFDHLTDIIEHFVERKELRRYAIYAQDFGGPVGFRLATRHPERVSALVVQNANAYDQGISKGLRELLQPWWDDRNPQTEAPVLQLFGRKSTLFQYQTGARDPASMNPDAWNLDQYGLDRPGNLELQVELHANYVTNLARYPEWQAYFEKHQPPTLVVWGKGDPVFTVEGAEAYRTHLKDVEVHLLDTGHFALEEDHALIAEHIRRFFRDRRIR